MVVGEQNQEILQPWMPDSSLQEIDSLTVGLSKGFLRSRPQAWFPGFASQWMPLFHSLGLESKLLEVSPLKDLPQITAEWSVFEAQVDGESMGVCLDQSSAAVISNSVTPGADSTTREISREYMIRRLVGSLALSWSGGEANVLFNPISKLADSNYKAAIKLSCTISSVPLEIWFLLGSQLLSKLDNLWRAQLRSVGQTDVNLNHKIQVELTQLAVPPSMLADYTRPGTLVDLEMPVEDRVFLRLDGSPWLPGRLCKCNSQFVVKVISGPIPNRVIPSDSSRLSIDLGELTLSSLNLAESSQIGAVIATQIPVSNLGRMMIHETQAAQVEIGIYQGKFAVKVLG
ncbi:MAG: hypothetical protein R3A13_08465 [Bdellovibrionota bacterium]